MMNLQLAPLVKRLGIDPAKIGLKKVAGDDLDAAADGAPVPAKKPDDTSLIDTTNSIGKALMGSTTLIEEFYFPPDIIGGMCPHVPGAEEETAWHAAAEACDSERVHVVWQAFDGRLWFLAVRSAELASHPNSWCPFSALLPGMKEALTPPVCYTYYGDEIASMMTVSEDGLHIYRGTNPIVRAKVERTARALGNAAVIDLVAERISGYEPVPWHSVSLFEDRARRVLATAAIAVSLILISLSFLVWLMAGVSLITSRHDMTEALARTETKTLDLLTAAQNLRATPVRDALTKFVDLNEGLLDLNGYLEIYVIKEGKVRWRATVPSNITADRINAIGGKTIDTKANGTVIGNANQIEFEAAGGSDKK